MGATAAFNEVASRIGDLIGGRRPLALSQGCKRDWNWLVESRFVHLHQFDDWLENSVAKVKNPLIVS